MHLLLFYGTLVLLTLAVTGQPSNDVTTEEPCENLCINGPDRGNCTVVCDCGVNGTDYYTGPTCSQLLLDVTSYMSSARTVNFTWPSPPELARPEDYRFVYRELPERAGGDVWGEAWDDLMPGVVYVQAFRLITERVARIIALDSGGVNYTICVLTQQEAEWVQSTNNMSRLDHVQYPDCVSALTQDSLLWGYQLAAIITGSVILASVVGLIALRLICDRIEGKKELEKDLERQLAMSINTEMTQFKSGTVKSDALDSAILQQNGMLKPQTSSKAHGSENIARDGEINNEMAPMTLSHNLEDAVIVPRAGSLGNHDETSTRRDSKLSFLSDSAGEAPFRDKELTVAGRGAGMDSESRRVSDEVPPDYISDDSGPRPDYMDDAEDEVPPVDYASVKDERFPMDPLPDY